MPKMEKKIKVIVQGQGSSTWAYALSDTTYKRLAKNNNDEDPLEMIRSEFIGSELVTWGIHSDSYPCPDIKIEFENVVTKIEEIIISGEESEVIPQGNDIFYMRPDSKKSSKTKKKNSIECNEKNRVELGDQMRAELGKKKINAIAFESTFFSSIALSVEISVDDGFKISELSLYDNDMDTETDLSRASYPLSIPATIDDGQEHALLGIVYKNKKFPFENFSKGGSNIDYVLVCKDNDGDWALDHRVSLI